jgi:hypothetical protein
MLFGESWQYEKPVKLLRDIEDLPVAGATLLIIILPAI